MVKGLGGLGDLAKMMKAAQEMQGKMAELQQKWFGFSMEIPTDLPDPVQ